MFVELYVLFALTTALTGLYELMHPVLSSVKKNHPDLSIVEHLWLSYLVSFILLVVLAPVVLPIVLVPSIGSTFRISLFKTLTENQG
jgi:hypothetical protein